MIIVEIKTRHKLNEAPLIDLIKPKGGRSNYLGSAGMKKDPEQFKKTTTKLYEKTKQNLVIVIPNDDLKRKIFLEKADSGVNPLATIIPTSHLPSLEKILEDKNIDPNSVFVLMPISSPFKGDYKEPVWSMVHDLIGHSLAASNLLNPPMIFSRSGPLKYLFAEYSQEQKDYISKILSRSLYAGVEKSFQVGGVNVDDEKPGFRLFDVGSPHNDDRWSDILASIALDEFTLQNSLDFLKAYKEGETLIKPLEYLINYLIVNVKKLTQWEPGHCQFLAPW